MAASGQTINDRLNAVRYALVGQGLARTVCKATTLEVAGPKKKHIDYLIACTNEPNVSTPQLANLLIERTQHANWAAVFKSLITIHHLMSYGNERFTQYLATSNHSFELADFMDRTTPQGYNMSAFVRRYAKYINDKSISYRTLAIDLCKIRSGNDNALRTMNMDNLSKTLPIVQAQFDSLLEFCAEPKDLNNGVIMAAFRLLYKDLVRLYVAYQEAIINLLERYFKLSRKKTREALELYKKYLARMNKVAGFLQVVDAVGLDKSEMPDLTNSPASILKLLEQHLAQLEAKKHGGAATPASPELDQAAGEADADGDGDETPTKDGERPASRATSEAASDNAAGIKATPQKVEPPNQPPPHPAAKQQTATAAAAGDRSKPKPPPVSTEPAQERPAPPQKPARPSPKASPKVSPASQKPAPAATSSAAPPASSTSPAPSAASGSEKKGPPERPAKPPSRPPPPSSSTPSGPVASPPSSSTPTACAPAATEPPATSHQDGPSAPTQAKVASTTTAASPTPPPPPPPPPAQTSSPAPAATNEVQPEPEAPQQVASNANTNGSGGGQQAEPDDGAPATTCSVAAAVVGSETAESADGTSERNHSDAIAGSEANEQELNHLNNGTSCQVVAAAEEEIVPPPPPPPPPIDDNEFENIQQEQQGQAGDVEAVDENPQEPIANGQSGHEGAE